MAKRAKRRRFRSRQIQILSYKLEQLRLVHFTRRTRYYDVSTTKQCWYSNLCSLVHLMLFRCFLSLKYPNDEFQWSYETCFCALILSYDVKSSFEIYVRSKPWRRRCRSGTFRWATSSRASKSKPRSPVFQHRQGTRRTWCLKIVQSFFSSVQFQAMNPPTRSQTGDLR